MKNKTDFYLDVQRFCKGGSTDMEIVSLTLWEARKAAIIRKAGKETVHAINAALRFRFKELKETTPND